MVLDFKEDLYIYDIDEGEELYVPIIGFEGLYEISNYGNVKALYKERFIQGKYSLNLRTYPEKILKPSTTPNGYYLVTLCNDGKMNYQTIHKLVAIHFIKNNDKLPIINHKDINKLNNFYKNLEWCTHSDNSKHSVSHGLQTSLFSSKNQPSNRKLNFSNIEITSTIKVGK